MKIDRNIWFVTFVLSSIAGYCDATTFVAADYLFSAHVTGNFIVFAYELVKGTDTGVWIKLSTFPVFIISVIIGGWVVSRSTNKYLLLIIEGILLTLSGIIAYWLKSIGHYNGEWNVFLAMVIVFAMGFQNTFGKLFSKETHGPTTVMTGNVTQAALDIYSIISSKFKDDIILLSFKKQSIMIGGFLIGSLCGALLGRLLGLSAIAFPGLILLFSYLDIGFSLRKNV